MFLKIALIFFATKISISIIVLCMFFVCLFGFYFILYTTFFPISLPIIYLLYFIYIYIYCNNEFWLCSQCMLVMGLSMSRYKKWICNDEMCAVVIQWNLVMVTLLKTLSYSQQVKLVAFCYSSF